MMDDTLLHLALFSMHRDNNKEMTSYADKSLKEYNRTMNMCKRE